MIEAKDLNKMHQSLIKGYETCMEDVFNIIVSDCLGDSLIGHYLSYEGNEKKAEEFRDELYAYLIASKQDLINGLSDMEAEHNEYMNDYMNENLD